MDFDGNAAIISKYGAFTLVYSQFLTQLGEFKRALSPETGFTPEQVCAGVDDVVGKLLREGQPASLDEAARLLSDGLRYERGLKTDRVPELAPLYDALSDAIKNAAPTWYYREDVDRWHSLGCDLARRFYAASPHSATQERLAREASLCFEWAREARQAPFGYREDRLRAAKTTVAGTITVRFSFSESQADSFVNYLAYPFYFVHEYVSHIYTASAKSDMFTDGWLLFAAHSFLRRRDAFSEVPLLLPEQIDAIDAVLPQSGIARPGYTLARRFQAWADAVAPGCFDQLSHRLATLMHVGGLSHTCFLWTLERELTEARPRLRKNLEAGNCLPENLLESH
jgi:hypothetical protein